METTRIPGTDLRPGRIALGTWSIGGSMWGGTDETQALRTLASALERGINLIDTAPVYGFGVAEERVGRALAAHGRRGEVLVATKVGLDWDASGRVWRDSSPARIGQEIEDSLSRLGTTYVDLYQVHWPDPRVPVAETARALERLLAAGKIRAIGVSNFTPQQMAAFREVAPLHTAQPPYNLFERGIEDDVLPWCREHGVATLAYGALCRSLLSGRVVRGASYPPDDLRRVDPKFREPRLGGYLAAVDRLDRLARERYGKTVLHLAVRWLLDHGADVALWGARRPEQLDAAAEVEGWRLDGDTLAEIDRILAETVKNPVGPEFMAPPEG